MPVGLVCAIHVQIQRSHVIEFQHRNADVPESLRGCFRAGDSAVDAAPDFGQGIDEMIHRTARPDSDDTTGYEFRGGERDCCFFFVLVHDPKLCAV
mgnify:CR=1 FL=1